MNPARLQAWERGEKPKMADVSHAARFGGGQRCVARASCSGARAPGSSVASAVVARDSRSTPISCTTHLGVELAAGAGAQLAHRGPRLERPAPRAVRGHRVVGVAGQDDAARERDVLALAGPADSRCRPSARARTARSARRCRGPARAPASRPRAAGTAS